MSVTSFNLKAALLDAAQTGNTQVFQMLLSLDPSLLSCRDGNGATPLSTAALRRHTELMSFLLKQPDIDINYPDEKQCIPLIRAIEGTRDSLEIADMLLARVEIKAD